MDESKRRDPEYVWKHYRNPWGPEGSSKSKSAQWARSQLIRHSLVCFVIFMGVWGLFRLDAPWAEEAKHAITLVLTREMNLEAAAAWYERQFDGYPSFIPSFREYPQQSGIRRVGALTQKWQIPVDGKISASHDETQRGIELKTRPAARVVAAGEGRVLYIGRTPETGLTLVLQHEGNVQSVYGRLNSSPLSKNDWIKQGEPVGKASATGSGGRLYFAMIANEQYVDPEEVMAFD